MRIVEVISGLGLGGAEKALARRLEYAPDHIETHVLVTGPQASQLVDRIAGHATIHREVTAMGRLIDRIQPDLILTHNPREALRVLSSPVLPRRYPVVPIAHNEITSEYKNKARLLNRALPLINSRARMHLAVSTRAARGPQCLGSTDIRVCLLGGTFNQSRPPLLHYWPSNAGHRVLVLSRISPQKNLFSLVEAITDHQDLLRSRGAHVVVAGDGEFMKTLQAAVSEQGVADLISLPGWIDDRDGLLAAAQTLLVTSSHEGGPLALYEALLAGIRVVSTPVGAADDVLGDDPYLRILPGVAPEALAEGLELIVQDAPLESNEIEMRRSKSQWLHARARAHAFYGLCSEACS